MRKERNPGEGNLFEIFDSMAENADATVGLLTEMMERFDNLSDRASAIRGKEHLGDSHIQDLVERLNSPHLTAADREDLQLLASAIDDVIDLADAAAGRMALFDIQGKIYGAAELARVLRLQTRHIRKAVESLPAQEGMLGPCREIHRLENEGDRILQEAVGRLLREEVDPIGLIKRKEVLESLERATNTCQDVATVLESIGLKCAR
jgi:uncharacterized protein Yka (UPF0111/DUF47 family)